MPSEAFQEVRTIIKERFKAQDAVMLVRWLLTHFQDNGQLRSPGMARRKRIVLDGTNYVLVTVEDVL